MKKFDLIRAKKKECFHTMGENCFFNHIISRQMHSLFVLAIM